MARYEERGYTYSNKKQGRYLEIYEQPRFWHFLADAYHFWDMRTFKLFRLFEPMDRWIHNRRCNDDCMTGMVGQRDSNGEWQERMETYCAHMPLTVRQDMKCYDLHEKNKTVVSREYYDEDEVG